VVDTASGQVLGSVDEERAPSTVHEGAIYLHLGESFRVLSLDLAARAALVEPFSGDYYTQTKRETLTTIEKEQRRELRLGVELRFGHVSVTEQVIAFQKRSIRTQEAFDLVALDLPPHTFDTEAIWFCPEPWMLEELGHATRPNRAAAVTGKRPEAAVTELDGVPRLLGTLHAAEHSLIALLPLWAMCDRWDIGGLSTNVHPQTRRPTIFVYDGHPGGVGITERGFDRFEGWAGDTAAMLAGCPCECGCPSCVQSPKCGNLNEPLDKEGALTLLRRMLGTGS
jgi:DEAD/DEAH box helicase domain-containing protein